MTEKTIYIVGAIGLCLIALLFLCAYAFAYAIDWCTCSDGQKT